MTEARSQPGRARFSRPAILAGWAAAVPAVPTPDYLGNLPLQILYDTGVVGFVLVAAAVLTILPRDGSARRGRSACWRCTSSVPPPPAHSGSARRGSLSPLGSSSAGVRARGPGRHWHAPVERARQ